MHRRQQWDPDLDFLPFIRQGSAVCYICPPPAPSFPPSPLPRALAGVVNHGQLLCWFSGRHQILLPPRTSMSLDWPRSRTELLTGGSGAGVFRGGGGVGTGQLTGRRWFRTVDGGWWWCRAVNGTVVCRGCWRNDGWLLTGQWWEVKSKRGRPWNGVSGGR